MIELVCDFFSWMNAIFWWKQLIIILIISIITLTSGFLIATKLTKTWLTIIAVFIFLVIAILGGQFIVSTSSFYDTMTINERMTFVLQILIAFATACISLWALSIAYHKMKHWELEQCDKLEEEWIRITQPTNIETLEVLGQSYDDEGYYLRIINFLEKIALLERQNFIDKETLFTRFYSVLSFCMVKEEFYKCLNDIFIVNKCAYSNIRYLYIKWVKKMCKELKKGRYQYSWDKMQKVSTKVKESSPSMFKRSPQ